MDTLRCTACLAWLLLVLTGCDGTSRGNDKPPDFRALGELPGLASSGDAALQDEFARLTAEGATPTQMASVPLTVADEQNVAVGLRTVLSAEKVMRANNDVSEIYPHGKFVWTAGSLERARDLLKYHQPAIVQMRAALDRPQCAYSIAFHDGMLVDLTEFETARLAHRWEALQAAIDLTDSNVAGAEQSLTRMLRLDQQLAQTKHVVPRLQAASQRLEALRVLAALMEHPQVNAAIAQRVHGVLQQQLAQWPDEAEVWTGDRAIGLHAYEMIRKGYILSLLSEEELADLRQKSSVSATARGIVKHLDRDERFYLENMRAIIAASSQPYYQRKELLTKLRATLQESRDAENYPLVAGQILLVDLDPGQRRLAEERAACEGWLLALASATGAELPKLELNPLTGLGYEVERDGTRIVVRRALEGDGAIVAPAF